MKSNYKRLGDYIAEVKERNLQQKAEKLLGINIDKYFMPSVANVVGTDLSVYKLVKKNQFACNRMHVGRDYRLPISMSKIDEEFMVSPAYDVFEIKNTEILYPEYLMMWFSRREFDRNAWFYTDADVRGGLAWKAFEDMQLPIPSIEKQREIVKEYNVIQNRIKLNSQLIQKLEETAQAIYKQWFVDFEFLCLPENYKFSGADKPEDFDSIMSYKRVGGLPIPDGKSWFAYVILCEDNSFYKGMTNDLYCRFYEHYKGIGAEWTKVHKPIKVIHWEHFNTKEEAANREKELKSGFGRTWLQRQYEKLKSGLPAPKTQLRTAGEMVFNEELEKEIPKGWSVGTLGDCIIFSNGYGFKSEKLLDDEICDCYSVFKMGNIKKGGGFKIDGTKSWIEKAKCKDLKKFVLKRGDLLMCMTDMKDNIGLLGNTALMTFDDKFIVNQRVGLLRVNNDIGVSYRCLYLITNSTSFLQDLRSRANRGVQVNLTTAEITSTKIILADYKTNIAFDGILKAIFSNIDVAVDEIQLLEKTKSLLLSKLATGEDKQ